VLANFIIIHEHGWHCSSIGRETRGGDDHGRAKSSMKMSLPPRLGGKQGGRSVCSLDLTSIL